MRDGEQWGRSAPILHYLCQVLQGKPGKPPARGTDDSFGLVRVGPWRAPLAPRFLCVYRRRRPGFAGTPPLFAQAPAVSAAGHNARPEIDQVSAIINHYGGTRCASAEKHHLWSVSSTPFVVGILRDELEVPIPRRPGQSCYCDSPTRRRRSTKRGSERRGSKTDQNFSEVIKEEFSA